MTDTIYNKISSLGFSLRTNKGGNTVMTLPKEKHSSHVSTLLRDMDYVKSTAPAVEGYYYVYLQKMTKTKKCDEKTMLELLSYLSPEENGVTRVVSTSPAASNNMFVPMSASSKNKVKVLRERLHVETLKRENKKDCAVKMKEKIMREIGRLEAEMNREFIEVIEAVESSDKKIVQLQYELDLLKN
jgi:hypothetical protein